MGEVETPRPRFVRPPKPQLDYLAGASTDFVSIPQPDGLIPTKDMSPHEQYPGCHLEDSRRIPTVGFIDRFSKTWYSSPKAKAIVLVPQSFLFYIVCMVVSALFLLLVRLGFSIWEYWVMHRREVDMGEGGDAGDMDMSKGQGSSLAGREALGFCLPESDGESGDENPENGVFKNSTRGIAEVGLGGRLGEKESVSIDLVKREAGCEKVEEKEEVVLVEVCEEGGGEVGENEGREEEIVEEEGEKRGSDEEEPDRGDIRGTGAREEGNEKGHGNKGGDESKNVKENEKGEKNGNREEAESKSDEKNEEGENRAGEKTEGIGEEDGDKKEAGIKGDDNGGEDGPDEVEARKSDEVLETEGILGEYGGNIESKENLEEVKTKAKRILGGSVSEGVEEREEDEGGVVLPFEPCMLTK